MRYSGNCCNPESLAQHIEVSDDRSVVSNAISTVNKGRSMIWKSKYWKEELAKTAEFLRESGSSTVLENDKAQIRLEKEIMWAAYAIRKLQDSKKLSESMIKLQIFAERYPTKSKHVDHMNWHKLNELYEFNEMDRYTFSLRQFCNEVIHSWVFATDHDEDGKLDAVLVSSDSHRNEWLFRIELDELLKPIDAVGNDCPNTVRMSRDPETGDWNVTNLTKE